MTGIRRAVVWGLAALVWAPALALGQAAGPSVPDLTVEQMEAFLLTAEIQSMRRIGEGTTGAQIATLSDGQLTHDAQVQAIDESRASIELGGRLVLNFVDSYRYNVAAYRLARFLGIENVPVSVVRRVQRDPAAVTWWLDDVAMRERDRLEQRAGGEASAFLSQQLQRMYVFDALIWNWDRNRGNMLWSSDWTLWMIDHTRAFRFDEELRTPQELQRVERSLLEALRGLTADAVAGAVGDTLTEREIAALLVRRDLIVAHYDARITERGEAAVLYDLTPP